MDDQRVVEGQGLVAGRGGSRTLRALEHPNGFEDREGHRAPSVPTTSFSEEAPIPAVGSSPGSPREVFEREALAHLPALSRFARRLAGPGADAEDLVQECLARALRFFHNYREGTNCRAWLFRIMHNLHINRWQIRRRRPQAVSLEEARDHHLQVGRLLAGNPDLEGDPEHAFFASNPDPAVKQALGSLSPEFRTPVLLFDLEGFSYQEIAQAMGIPVGTVRSRLNRARRRLQTLLADHRPGRADRSSLRTAS